MLNIYHSAANGTLRTAICVLVIFCTRQAVAELYSTVQSAAL